MIDYLLSKCTLDLHLKEVSQLADHATLKIKVRTLRKAKKLTQEKLAGRVGVSKTAVYAWEKGAYLPEGNNLINLAKELETTVGFLLGETDNPKREEREKSDSETLAFEPDDEVRINFKIPLEVLLKDPGAADKMRQEVSNLLAQEKRHAKRIHVGIEFVGRAEEREIDDRLLEQQELFAQWKEAEEQKSARGNATKGKRKKGDP